MKEKVKVNSLYFDYMENFIKHAERIKTILKRDEYIKFLEFPMGPILAQQEILQSILFYVEFLSLFKISATCKAFNIAITDFFEKNPDVYTLAKQEYQKYLNSNMTFFVQL